MTTPIIYSINAVTKFALSLILITTMACSNQAQEQDNKTAASKSETKVMPPKTDIHTAVITGDLDAVKQHIAAGSNLDEKDPFGGSSPLITAALFGRKEMVKVLIEGGADINFKNNEGSTALHTAAFFCREDIVQLLLDKGADKSITNKYGSTAFASVSGPYSDVKGIYQMMETQLAPMGLTLDHARIEKMRPEIAQQLK